MKKTYILIVLLNLLSFLTLQLYSQSCTHTFYSVQNIIDGDEFNPGDIICLMAGNWNFLLLRNIHGTADNPIIIKNYGPVNIISSTQTQLYGIKFDRCSNVILSGGGNEQFDYGISIKQVANGAGISIDNLSTDVEIERVEVSNVSIGGIYAKTEPDYFGDCSFIATREKFVMKNISIHDCYLHDIGDEGFYIGSSKYTGQTIYHCNDTVVLPHLITGVSIYNNIVDNTGWDAIQVSSTVSDCYIYNNTITNDSYKQEPFQMSGILIGGGANCDCFDNSIMNGKGDGIDVLGLGNHKIYNNLIVRAGKTLETLDDPITQQKHGIWFGAIANQSGSKSYIYNNTIVSPRSFGIKLTNTLIGEYSIYNNLIVNPGALNYVTDDAYLNITSGINSQHSNNYYNADVEAVKFENYLISNFDLTAQSPAVNTGLNLQNYGLLTDILGRSRPFADKYDIGAYESHDPSINGTDDPNINRNKILSSISPNPMQSSSKISIYLSEKSLIKIKLFNQLGQERRVLIHEDLIPGKYDFHIKKNDLKAGVYYISIENNNSRDIGKLIIQ